VLSGANQDGSKGITAVSEAGGAMWVQAPDTAEARSMPDAALAASARARALGLDSMTELLTQGVERR